MLNLKQTLIDLLKAFIALVKAEPGQQAELDALKAKVADLQEQLASALPIDEELRAVIAEASEAAAAATPAPVADEPAPIEAPAADQPADPETEATEVAVEDPTAED